MLFTLFVILTLAYILIQMTTSFEKRVKVYQMSDPKLSLEEAENYGRKAGWDDPILVKYFFFKSSGNSCSVRSMSTSGWIPSD